MLSQRAIRGKQKLASIAPLVAASAAEVSNPCRRQRPLISSTLCDAASVQGRAFQRSLSCAWQSRRTSADPCPRQPPAAFQPRSAALAVHVSLSAAPECIRHEISFGQRLANEAKRAREVAIALPDGKKRDAFFEKARLADLAARINGWLGPPELKSSK